MNFIKNGGNSVLGMQFRTCKNFWTSTDSSLVDSPKIFTNTKAILQSLPLRFYESQNLGENHAKIAESSADSAKTQNLIKQSLLKFLLLFAFAKRRVPLNLTNSNPPSKANSQNLVKNNPCEAPKNSPASWCKKSESKGAVVPPADFLLEADKRGSPPKSEKAAAFWEHNKKELGGAGRGVQPFLRKESSKISGEGFAESTLDSANPALSTHEANSAIADEFLGFCEVSDKDKTKVYRGSEARQSLKRRCESKFAVKFDKYDFYFLLVALASLLSLIYLISGASISYKEAIILRENSTAIAKIANFSLAHFSQNLGLDFSAKLPNLMFHTLNLVLIYLISNKILKYKRDSVLCVGIYALIPGVIMQASIVNDTILILSIVLFVCYIELRARATILIYPLLLSAVLISKSAFMLCLALFFYTLFKNTNAIPSKDTNQKAHFWIRFWENRIANLKSNAPILIFSTLCFGLNLYLFGIDISGRPRGQSLDTIAELALLYSPPLFVYFVYTIYRNFTKGNANLLLYIVSISLFVSIVLSVRQDVNKEIYMFMSLCGIPLMVRQMLSDIRLRLPAFQEGYKKRFFIVIAVLLVESSALIFSKQIYRFTNESEIFLNQFYIAKEVASELKARGISRVSVEGRMQERLAFYGIKDGGQKLRKVKRGGNIVVEYNGKIVARYAI